jgi:plasmid stabilization system protein ParE
MNDKKQFPPAPSLPALAQIEQDGADAALRMAKTILQQTLANNGVVDLTRLERFGPDVRRRYVRLLAEHAAPLTAAPRSCGETRTPVPSSKSTRPTSAPFDARIAKASQLNPRATTEWRNLRRERLDFRTRAFRRGLLVAGILTATAVVVVRRLHI